MSRIIVGDCRESLRTIADQSVQMCVTSPPYYGLRDYGHGDQIGLEKTPAEYVEKMVGVFREVRRVLRDDGTLWLNIGDSYATDAGKCRNPGGGENSLGRERKKSAVHPLNRTNLSELRAANLKPKDLIGIPWMLAFALRGDGWYLRSDIIWHKPNPMPESVTDRPTKSHEYLFLFAKSERYYYDAPAITEDSIHPGVTHRAAKPGKAHSGAVGLDTRPKLDWTTPATRNRRTVWTVATSPFKGAHFATFPPKLIEPCILAGSSSQSCEHCGQAWTRQVERTSIDRTELPPDDPRYRPRHYVGAGGDDAPYAMGQRRGMFSESRTLGFAPSCDCGSVKPVPSTVLDPFAGAFTTGLVAHRLGREYILCELNPEYAKLGEARIHEDAPLFSP